jgi:glycosyltransferase involved in cell wall biosynthesis
VGRVPKGIPPELIVSFPYLGFKYARRRAAATNASEFDAINLWAAQLFNERIIRRGLEDSSMVYTFDGEGLEVLEYARQTGRRAVMEQCVAPKEIVTRVLLQEEARFPRWQRPLREEGYAPELTRRTREEWQRAELIICGSEFVRDGVEECGGPVSKCAVVPYGVDSSFNIHRDGGHKGPLRVLTVGTICLRKGSPYVLEAAHRLGIDAEFRMVGPLGVSPEIAQQLQRCVQLVGPVPREEIRRHYAWADIFLFPSMCEGSALVVYEALAAGLPVITTPNAGTIVRDGTDGFVLPAGDSEAIVEKIRLFLGNRTLLREFSASAKIRSQEGSLSAYQRRLLTALGNLDSSGGNALLD